MIVQFKEYKISGNPNKLSNHPCMLLLFLLLFGLNLSSFHIHYDITGSYWLSTSIISFFNKDYNTTSDWSSEIETLRYTDINTLNDLSKYYICFIPKMFFNTTDEDSNEYK